MISRKCQDIQDWYEIFKFSLHRSLNSDRTLFGMRSNTSGTSLIFERMIRRSLTTLKMKPADRLAVPSIRLVDLDRGRGHVQRACLRYGTRVIRAIANHIGETKR